MGGPPRLAADGDFKVWNRNYPHTSSTFDMADVDVPNGVILHMDDALSVYRLIKGLDKAVAQLDDFTAAANIGKHNAERSITGFFAACCPHTVYMYAAPLKRGEEYGNHIMNFILGAKVRKRSVNGARAFHKHSQVTHPNTHSYLQMSGSHPMFHMLLDITCQVYNFLDARLTVDATTFDAMIKCFAGSSHTHHIELPPLVGTCPELAIVTEEDGDENMAGPAPDALSEPLSARTRLITPVMPRARVHIKCAIGAGHERGHRCADRWGCTVSEGLGAPGDFAETAWKDAQISETSGATHNASDG